ncbi:hypothetical protein, partial [Mesorhizobium sp. M2E.F.Ca.ET.209.01.1.1]|uniref:hypothetical protein n=1 Tax=Mesorhizobium sp. M2E.F.Ca.ET.209.01.1.1 TaxID=2500526 RepID=UPI001AED9F28
MSDAFSGGSVGVSRATAQSTCHGKPSRAVEHIVNALMNLGQPKIPIPFRWISDIWPARPHPNPKCQHASGLGCRNLDFATQQVKSSAHGMARRGNRSR